MPQQRPLNLNRRHPPPAGLETVITASHVIPVAVAIAAIQIPGAHPTIDKRIRSRFGFFPVIHRRAFAFDPKVSLGIRRSWFAILVNESRFVALEQTAAAAVA